jgi:hypothetical protein
MQTRLDKHKNRVDIRIVGERHAAIGVHRRRSKELHIVILGKNPLAQPRGRCRKRLDFGTSHLVVILELLAKILAVGLKVFLNILLAHGNFVQVESNGFVNDIVDQLGSIVDSFVAASATEFTTATNIDTRTRILI